MKNWNERFVYYALFNGNSPEKQLEIDKEEYPGGSMCGFISWISKSQEEFKAAYPSTFYL